MIRRVLMLIFVSLAFEKNILISQLSKNIDSFSDIIVKEKFKEQAKLAYIDFLKKFSKTETYQVYEFSLRDFDKDGIPELIIVQSNAVHGILSVYYYDGDLKKYGDYSNPKIGQSALRVSDNPTFPGLFTLWWGGGVEHYEYLYLDEGILKESKLWEVDRTGEFPCQKILFSDEELVEESMKLFSENDDEKNLLELYLIDDYKKVLEAGN